MADRPANDNGPMSEGDMGRSPQDGLGAGSTPLERELRQLLEDEAITVRVGEAPYGQILKEGRQARHRSRMVLGAGLAVLVAVPGGLLAAQSFTPSSEPAGQVSPAAGGGIEGGGGGHQEAPQDEGAEATGAEEEAADHALPPSDPERQLLDGITLEQARDQLDHCIDDWADRSSWPTDEQPELDASGLRILLAWDGSGGENQGHGTIRRVLAATADQEEPYTTRLVCSQRVGEGDAGSGIRSSVGADIPDGEVVGDTWGRYATPEDGLEGDWSGELPFRWAHFDTIADSVDRVTVEYGGDTQEALLEGGFYITAGILEAPPEAMPRVRAYDEDGELIHDSAAATQ